MTEVGGDILHWDGSTWSVADHVTGTPGGTFTGVTAVSSTDVWVFGFSPAGPGLGTWHFDGKTWTSVTGSASMVVAASAVSANDIWATSDTASGVPALVRYAGTTWSRVKNAPALSYQGILALSASDVWATGSDTSNKRWLARMSSGAWTKVAVPWTGLSLGDLVPDGSGGLWLSALGSGGTSWILHYSASGRWSRTAFTATIIALANMPGTRSALAGGWVNTSTGANATVWAHGTL